MNKADIATIGIEGLANIVAKEMGLSRERSYDICKSLFMNMVKSINEGKKIEVRGYFVMGSKISEARYVNGLGGKQCGYMPKQRRAYFRPLKNLTNMPLLEETQSQDKRT